MKVWLGLCLVVLNCKVAGGQTREQYERDYKEKELFNPACSVDCEKDKSSADCISCCKNLDVIKWHWQCDSETGDAASCCETWGPECVTDVDESTNGVPCFNVPIKDVCEDCLEVDKAYKEVRAEECTQVDDETGLEVWKRCVKTLMYDFLVVIEDTEERKVTLIVSEDQAPDRGHNFLCNIPTIDDIWEFGEMVDAVTEAPEATATLADVFPLSNKDANSDCWNAYSGIQMSTAFVARHLLGAQNLACACEPYRLTDDCASTIAYWWGDDFVKEADEVLFGQTAKVPIAEVEMPNWYATLAEKETVLRTRSVALAKSKKIKTSRIWFGNNN